MSLRTHYRFRPTDPARCGRTQPIRATSRRWLVTCKACVRLLTTGGAIQFLAWKRAECPENGRTDAGE